MGEERKEGNFFPSSCEIIDFSSYLNRRRNHTLPPIWILSNKSTNDFRALQLHSTIEWIENRTTWANRRKPPDLVLIESCLQWEDPIHLIEEIAPEDIPIILVCPRLEKDPAFVKRAYAAGISDILCRPFDSDELVETTLVLLKFRKQARMY